MESMISRRIVYCWGILLLTASGTFAQCQPSNPRSGVGPKLALVGRVVNAQDNTDIPFVMVKIEGPQRQLFVTDAQGHFQFLCLDAGNYTAVATKEGFQPSQTQFALLSSGISDGLIRMEPLARIARKPEGKVLSVREAQIPSEARKFFERGTKELYEDKKPENSVSDFLRAIEIYPDYDEAYLRLGIAYGRLARPEEAEKILRKGIQVYAQNAQAHLFLGKLLKEQGKMLEAVEELEKALKIDDTLWLAHLDLARILEKQRKTQEAYEHARRAHELNSAVQDVHLAFYNACIGTGDYPGALAELDEVVKLYPDSDAARKLQALRPKLAADAAAMKH
jgi:hypothetical protein